MDSALFRRRGDFPVAVLCGGNSSEREISLRSGRAVYEALRNAGFPAELVDVRGEEVLAKLEARPVKMAFIAMHGKFGEDGQLQQLLQTRGIPYTGSGPGACRLAMDKAASRRRFEEKGLRIPKGIILENPLDPRIPLLATPLFAKPAIGGSSLGVTCVRGNGDLARALEAAFREDARVILEEKIDGREMTVGILGEEALPLIEIIPARDFFDYEAKYADAGTRTEEPRDLGAGERRRIEETALAAHRALGCSAFSRVDLIVNSGGAWVLEVNAIPGLTEKSLLPKMAARRGLAFDELCVRIMEESLKGEV